jgi:hypothetical protein
MALVTYLIGSCDGGPAILVDFDSSNLPAVNGNYFLRFTGATSEGCYDIIDNSEPSTAVDTVSFMSSDYGDCATCEAVVTPTPTPTVTTTQTPTVTVTQTNTSSPTPTPSKTPSVTSTPTPSVTTTQTPTVTQTGTASVTSTPTPTVTNTQTQTPSPTGTPNVTPTTSSTSTPTPTQTGTPNVTPTTSSTSTPTPTQTGTPNVTPSATPTPTPTPFYSGISVNQNYEYTAAMLGSFSGGTLPPGTVVPHPEYASDLNNGETIQVVQLNAITLGGFNGLNN